MSRDCPLSVPLPWPESSLFPPARAANLESRRVDVSNSTYKDRKEDLTYPAPGCGAGAWDGLPPGHKAQQVDLDVAAPVLSKLGLPASMEGACGAGRCEGAVGVAPILLTLRAPAHPPPSAGYACLFGRAYLGSPLGRGAVWEAAQRHEEVEELRYKARSGRPQAHASRSGSRTLRIASAQVAMASALHYSA